MLQKPIGMPDEGQVGARSHEVLDGQAHRCRLVAGVVLVGPAVGQVVDALQRPDMHIACSLLMSTSNHLGSETASGTSGRIRSSFT
jgi:hypothetical protein